MKAVSTWLLFAIVSVSSNAAPPVPQLRVAELVEASDIIAVGTILTIADVGPSSVTTAGGVVSARQILATLATDRVLKGRAATSLEFQLVLPDAGIGYGGVAAGDYRMFLLKGSGEPYQLVSPYYPSLAAVRGPSPVAGTALDRVFESLSEVANATNEPETNRQSAIFALWGATSRFATDGLMVALDDHAPAIRAGAAASLLASGDMRALPVAESALSVANPNVPSEVLHNLTVAIEQGLRRPQAIGALGRLMVSPNIHARRSAARALREVRSPLAVDALVRALDDVDGEVRYAAVVGLAEITAQPRWGPSLPEFHQNQQRYIDFWKNWRKQNP